MLYSVMPPRASVTFHIRPAWSYSYPTVRPMLSFASVIRLKPSYVNAIHRPVGDVTFRIFPVPEPTLLVDDHVSRQTLRVTPAMEAGVTDHVWSIEKIVSLLG